MTDESMANKISYLQMIQSTIDRMSTMSAVFKGFCATIITGISAVSFTKINKWILLFAVLPVICFLIIDVYYLQLERKFRVLYDEVRSGKHKIDYDLTPPNTRILRNKDVGIWSCLKSPSIYLFYGPSIVIAGIVVVMKFKGVI